MFHIEFRLYCNLGCLVGRFCSDCLGLQSLRTLFSTTCQLALCCILLLQCSQIYCKTPQPSTGEAEDNVGREFAGRVSLETKAATRSVDEQRGKEPLKITERIGNEPNSLLDRPEWPELTKPGGLVSTTVVDPLMTNAQERKLWMCLSSADNFEFQDGSVRQLVEQLNQILPTWLNEFALDREGLDPELQVSLSNNAVPLIQRLLTTLEAHELTFSINSGRLVITTQYSANERESVIRIYDVSPLVNGIRFGVQQLLDTVINSIEPVSWQQNGGASMISPHLLSSGGRVVVTFVAVAPTTTQMQVQAMLDRLNAIQGNTVSSLEKPASGISFKPRLYQNSNTSQLMYSESVNTQWDDRVRIHSDY